MYDINQSIENIGGVLICIIVFTCTHACNNLKYQVTKHAQKHASKDQSKVLIN